ncbi:MAG: UbiH/UbiF/VisC/COQ6 family ubiquinone biosynthesis hydroxylase [Hahellaceae bacterium]|nr:UbiH/UbiF/VisC/COQ6 family ubiquinone biosynthesis hydroxylase [Hahellaceae bacterium]MCP5168624.1 UbiH/UbiF/VisC/COQ6 family ubiquinone biosynthesis hydroxylase [Hahellaceae bacterium]
MHQENPELAVNEFDIVIVGGGMVGAALAVALRHSRFRIALVEGQSAAMLLGASRTHDSVSGFDPRVSALTAASQTFLANLGVWGDVLDAGACPYSDMCVWDGEGTGRIEFSAAELGQLSLGHIVENSATLGALYRKLSETPDVQQFLGAPILRVETGAQGQPSVLVLRDGRRLSGRLLVAADGANSLLRAVFGMATREWDYNHHAIVATVKTAMPHAHVARQRFMSTGPLAFLPLSDVADSNCFSSIVWSVEPEHAKALMALSEREFCNVLANAFEHTLGDVVGVSERYSFPLRQRHAKEYVKPGVVLVGDAAHTIHPLAGQGVNLGLMDVAALADELLKADRRDVAVNDLVMLHRYQRRRMTANLAMMGIMEGFKRLFAQDDLGLRLLRNTGMRWLNRQSFLKNRIVSEAMGLNIRVPKLEQATTALDKY